MNFFVLLHLGYKEIQPYKWYDNFFENKMQNLCNNPSFAVNDLSLLCPHEISN